MSVGQLATLRVQLRKSGGEYKVYKNTLGSLRRREGGLDGLAELLIGPTAITFVSGDAAGVAKALKRRRQDQPVADHQGWVDRRQVDVGRRTSRRSPICRAARCCWPARRRAARPRW